MRNVILKADEALIKRAQLAVRARHTTLNAAFREWLERYVAQTGSGVAVDATMRLLRHVRSSGPYARDEMNQR
jgi:hypothetical protein